MPQSSATTPGQGMVEAMEIKTAGELVADTSEPPPAVIGHGILLDQNLLLIYGRPKSRKTFLALNLGLAIASGQSFAAFEIPTAQKVLMLSAEGGYFPMRDRVKKMVGSLPAEYATNFWMSATASLQIDKADDLEALRAVLAEIGPKVLILDPFIRYHSAEENASKEMGAVFEVLGGLMKEFSISIILVHHEGKNPAMGARGSSVIHGSYDSGIKLTGDKDKVTLTFDLRHAENPPQRRVIFDSATCWFTSPTRHNIVLQILGERDGLSRKDLHDEIIRRTGVADATAYNRISAALGQDAIYLENRRFHIREHSHMEVAA